MNRPDDSPKNSILIYTTEDGLTKIDTTFDGDTVWLSIDQMADLFQRDKSTISRHIKNIFAEGELERDAVVAKFATTAADGKTYQVEFYNLDVIISVGYRVKSKRGTQFRIWATGILKEYMRKGFALDDERLKNLGGGGYFKELLERIRDIRASEKVFYRQVLEIYATSIPLSFWSKKQTRNNCFVRFLCHRKRQRFTFTPVFLRLCRSMATRWTRKRLA